MLKDYNYYQERFDELKKESEKVDRIQNWTLSTICFLAGFIMIEISVMMFKSLFEKADK